MPIDHADRLTLAQALLLTEVEASGGRVAVRPIFNFVCHTARIDVCDPPERMHPALVSAGLKQDDRCCEPMGCTSHWFLDPDGRNGIIVRHASDLPPPHRFLEGNFAVVTETGKAVCLIGRQWTYIS